MRSLKNFFLPVVALVFAIAASAALGQSAGQVQVVAPLTRDVGAIVTMTSLQGPTTVNSLDQSGFNTTRIVCVFRQTTSTGSPTSTFAIQNKDAASGQYYTLLTSSSVTTPATTNFIAAGGDLVNSANLTQAFPIARTWRTQLTVTSTATVTGTIGCSVQ